MAASAEVFVAHSVSATSSSAMAVRNGHRQNVNKPARPCSNKTLFIDTTIWISFKFHVTKYYSLIDVSQPFKNVKHNLSSGSYKSRQPARFGPQAVVCQPLPYLNPNGCFEKLKAVTRIKFCYNPVQLQG